MNKHINTVDLSINNFSLKEGDYKKYEHIKEKQLQVSGDGALYMKGELHNNARIHINFMKSNGSRVFIGDNFRGNIIVRISGNNSIVYIGEKNILNGVKIRSFQDNDLIATGSQVTVTQDNTWISGDGAGEGNPAIIIGDDCMLAENVIIRNSDAHPIFKRNGEQSNYSKSLVHIEPHVWLCQDVRVLKDVKIGACSIVGLGSIVTKNAPRFSITTGVPGKSKINKDIYWSRSDGTKAKKQAEYFFKKYNNVN